MSNAEVRFCVVEDQEQVDKMLEVRDQWPQLSHIFYDDPRGLRKYMEPGLSSMEDLLTSGEAFARQNPDFYHQQVEQGQAEDVAAMFLRLEPRVIPRALSTRTSH